MAARSEIIVSVSSVAMQNHHVLLSNVKQFYFVGCAERTVTVKIAMNFANDTVCNGALGAPYTFPKQANL
jgi:hypothetical protein